MTDNKSSVERCYLHLWWFYLNKFHISILGELRKVHAKNVMFSVKIGREIIFQSWQLHDLFYSQWNNFAKVHWPHIEGKLALKNWKIPPRLFIGINVYCCSRTCAACNWVFKPGSIPPFLCVDFPPAVFGSLFFSPEIADSLVTRCPEKVGGTGIKIVAHLADPEKVFRLVQMVQGRNSITRTARPTWDQIIFDKNTNRFKEFWRVFMRIILNHLACRPADARNTGALFQRVSLVSSSFYFNFGWFVVFSFF